MKEQNMKRAILLLVLCVPCAGFAAAEPELKGSPAELGNYLAGQQVQAAFAGEAEVKVPADRAVVTLRLSNEHKSLKEASQANRQLRASVTAYLVEQGIGAERIQSAKFSSTPRTGTFTDKVKSYRIESQVEVTVHDDKEFQAAAGSIDKWSDVTYLGVRFEHSEKDAMRLKTIGQACDNAMARKKTYEEKLGVKLTVKRFNESGEFRPIAPHWGDGIGAQGGTAPSFTGRPASLTTIPGVGEPTSAFGELVFKARVGIECSLETR
jgi:uncharacterized protein YggE